MSTSLNKLLQKKIDRKEFLLSLGLLLITFTGISGIMQTISSILGEKPKKGFGSGGYGA